MKKKIAVIVSYVIEAERDDYMQIEEGRYNFREDFTKGCSEKFPDEIQLTEKLHGSIDGVSTLPLNVDDINVAECPICGRLITDLRKPNPINTLFGKAVNVQGINICTSCEWEATYEVSRGRTLESVINEMLKKSNFIMKNKIVIVASYVIEADREDYIQIGEGSFREDFVNGYNEKFPDEIQLTEKLHGVRGGVTVIPINTLNVEECPICGYLMTDPEKPNPINIVLRKAINVQGINICGSCDFEIAYDVSLGRTVESIIEEVNSDKTMFNLHGNVCPKRLR